MEEINREIKLTLNLMKTDIDDGAYDELKSHLHSLLEMKRSDLQKSLPVGYWIDDTNDQSPPEMAVKLYVKGEDEDKPLTKEELESGGWWCADVSRECAEVIESKGLKVFNFYDWGDGEGWSGCSLDVGVPSIVSRKLTVLRHEREIHRIGNEFYWGKL